MTWLEIAKKVVDNGSYTYVNINTNEEVSHEDTSEDYVEDGDVVLLDMTTANMLVTVVGALNEGNRQMFTSLPIYKAVKVGWALLN
jgi:hypothetical protein